MDKRNIFFLLLGCSGVCLILFAHFLSPSSGLGLNRIVLISTNVQNTSFTYQASVNLDVIIKRGNDTSKSRNLSLNVQNKDHVRTLNVSNVSESDNVTVEHYFSLPNSKNKSSVIGSFQTVPELINDKSKHSKEINGSLQDIVGAKIVTEKTEITYSIPEITSKRVNESDLPFEIVYQQDSIQERPDGIKDVQNASASVAIDSAHIAAMGKAATDRNLDNSLDQNVISTEQDIVMNNVLPEQGQTVMNNVDMIAERITNQIDNHAVSDTERVININDTIEQTEQHIENINIAIDQTERTIAKANIILQDFNQRENIDSGSLLERGDAVTQTLPNINVHEMNALRDVVDRKVEGAGRSSMFSNRLLNIANLQPERKTNYGNTDTAHDNGKIENGKSEQMNVMAVLERRGLESNRLFYKGPDERGVAVYEDRNNGGLRIASVNMSEQTDGQVEDGTSEKSYNVDPACVKRNTGIEDVLCMVGILLCIYDHNLS